MIYLIDITNIDKMLAKNNLISVQTDLLWSTGRGGVNYNENTMFIEIQWIDEKMLIIRKVKNMWTSMGCWPLKRQEKNAFWKCRLLQIIALLTAVWSGSILFAIEAS